MPLIINPYAVATAVATVSLDDASDRHRIAFSPDDATASISLTSAGNISGSPGGTLGQWIDLPAQAANYSARWVTVSGTLSSGTADTWQSLDTTRTYAKTRTLNTAGSLEVTGTLEIALTSDTGTVLASKTITLTAEVQVL